MSVVKAQATGLACGEYDRVSYELTVYGHGSTGPKAKQQALCIIEDRITPTIRLINEKMTMIAPVFDDAASRTSFSVRPDTRKLFRNKYTATYTLHLESTEIEAVSAIHEILTSLEEVRVSSPSFTLDPVNRRKLQDLAVKVAFDVIEDRFKKECEILGQDSGGFKVKSWETTYSDTGDATIAVTNGRAYVRPPDAVWDQGGMIKSGRAAVRAHLCVSFERSSR